MTGPTRAEPPRLPDALAQRLSRGAFGALFRLGTLQERAEHLARSGLDPTRHDAPLSLHVYNLL